MRRTIAVAAMITLAGNLLPAGGAAGSPARPPELAGTTRIVGRATAATVVTLPHPVTVKTGALDETVVRVSGTGPLAGMVLRQDARRPAQVMALSMDPCSSPPCTQERTTWNDISVPRSGTGDLVTLPAGRYFLYFIAEGGRAEVKLRLKGLGGETILQPMGNAQRSFGELDAGVTGGAAGPVYRAAGAFELPRFGLRLAALEVETAPHLAGRYFSCLRKSVEPLPPGLRAFTCPGGSSWTIVTPEANDARVRFVALTTLGEGAYEEAMGFEVAAVAEEVSSFGFSLAFDGRDSGDRSFGQGIEYEERP